jgi:5-methylcytosine-specific restriction enzyme A
MARYFACAGCGKAYPPPRKRGRCPGCAREYERARGSAHARGYTKTHQRLAARAFAAHPFCADCGATTDLCADHIVPLSAGGTNSLDNYEVRCRSCNTSRRNRDRRNQAAKDLQPASRTPAWDARNRVLSHAKTTQRSEAVGGGTGLEGASSWDPTSGSRETDFRARASRGTHSAEPSRPRGRKLAIEKRSA